MLRFLLVLSFLAVRCDGFVPRLGFRVGQSATLIASTTERPQSSASSSSDGEDFVKEQLRKKQEEYELARKQKMAESIRGGVGDIPSLEEIELVNYLDEEGKIASLDIGKDVKASVYAVFDESKVLRFVGVSRSLPQSLRMHLARMPSETYYFKYHHITKPSRTMLEAIKENWLNEVGGADGNDGAEKEGLWERAMDVKPLMTEEDKAKLAEAKQISAIKEASTIKSIARRYENEKVEILEERGCKEEMRFCPKLKGDGLLDLWTKRTKDEVPKGKPQK